MFLQQNFINKGNKATVNESYPGPQKSREPPTNLLRIKQLLFVAAYLANSIEPLGDNEHAAADTHGRHPNVIVQPAHDKLHT